MSREHEKLMKDLHRLLETQNIESEEDLKKFLDDFDGKIPSFPSDVLNNKELAEDLVQEAYDLTPEDAKMNIEQALLLDEDCIEAYEFLGTQESSPVIAKIFLEKGVEIGRKQFGGQYLINNKGFFWGLHETRPFMRCLLHYSDCLSAMDKIEESIKIQEEMISLNSHDNLGIRDQLLTLLIRIGDDKKFKKYDKMFKEDGMAFARFNRALFAFKNNGATEKANQLLKDALEYNPYVAKLMLTKKEIVEIPSLHGIGDENEAKIYVYYAKDVWEMIDGAIGWMRKNK